MQTGRGIIVNRQMLLRPNVFARMGQAPGRTLALKIALQDIE
jgi:hypothetical protein